MGLHAYATSNYLVGFSASSFVWSNGATTDRSFLNDRRIDRQFVVGASVASGINVIVDTGGASQLVAVAALNSNAAVQKTDAALLVEASNNATFAADVNVAKAASTLFSTTQPRNKDHVLQFNANFSKRYWRLTWTWTGNVTNFAIGELFFVLTGSLTTLTRRSIYGSGAGKKMFTSSDPFPTGERRGLKLGGPQRVLDLRWSDMTASERDELDIMWSAAEGNVAPLLWIDSNEAVATAAAATEQDCVFGRIDEDEAMFSNPDFGRHEFPGFRIRSAGREAGA